MEDFAFRALLDIWMCDDPSNTQPDFRDSLEKFMDEEAKKRDFDDRYDAYHLFKPLRFEVMETYNGVKIPKGWTRVRKGLMEWGDKALSEGGKWIELNPRYAGHGVGMFQCVIREDVEKKPRRKKKRKEACDDK